MSAKCRGKLETFKLLVHDASNLELRSTFGVSSKLAGPPTFSVKAALTDEKGKPLGRAAGGDRDKKDGDEERWVSTSEASASQNDDDANVTNTCTWDDDCAILDLGSAELDARVTFVLTRSFVNQFVNKSNEVGRTSTTVRELVEMEDGADLFVFDDKDDVVPESAGSLPALVRVSVVERDEILAELLAPPAPPKEEKKEYAKHLMIITRGTRGDVQPFIALARGLAEMVNWEITFVTENEFKDYIKSQSKVAAGVIHWRPSGGDTMSKVSDPLAQKAINLKLSAKQTNVMQQIFLARSEYEFFTSEPAVFYWANKLKPDYLMFGFTMVSIAMIASEKLRIPLLGFVLQPTSIPSRAYPPVMPLKEESFSKLTQEQFHQKHDHFHLFKYCMDNAPIVNRLRDVGQEGHHGLSTLRERRGLVPFEGYEVNAWQELLDANHPLIVPINETMFGGKPDDWSENAVFTDCIFLRGESVPPVAADARAFIDGAKAMGGKVVVLAFSSMPVSKTQIIEIALKLVRECKEKVCVFALVGKQIDLPLDEDIREETTAALDEGRLFIAKGSPFGRLFPMVDAIVLHGGLGTTSEALQAQKPSIVTGVLLLDQRFWGARCASLKVGPYGTHIDDFPEYCVDYVDTAVEDGSVWRANAEKIGKMLKEDAGDDESGVRRNVNCVVRMSEGALPYSYEPDEESISSSGVGSVAKGMRSLLRDKLDSYKKKDDKLKNDDGVDFDSGEVYVSFVQ